MFSRTTSLIVLLIGAIAVTASVKRPAEKSAGKTDPRLQPSRTRPQDSNLIHVTLGGQILMPDGTAAAQARLFIAVRNEFGRVPEEIEIDPEGRFRRTLPASRIAGPADAFTLTAIVPGKAFLWRAYPVSDKRLGALSLRLAPAAGVTGRVVDTNGKPLPDIAVTIPRLGPDLMETRGVATERPASPLSEFLPPMILEALYRTRTDAKGRFTLIGLPTTGQLRLKLGTNVMPAPGSFSAIDLDNREQADVGILVAVKPGGLALHFTDRTTRKAAAGVEALVLPGNFSAQDLGTRSDDEDPAQPRLGGFTSDAQGDIALAALAPGEYRLLVAGSDRRITVTEAHTTHIDYTVRTEPLQGSIVDGAGKPVADIPITVEASPDPVKDRTGVSLMDAPQGARGAAVTDSNGKFTIASFPWEATAVTLRCARGNDEARWSGPARDIGKTLELRLRPGALVTVTGRLTDSTHTPVRSLEVFLLGWQDAPRLKWLAHARSVTVGPQGRFRIDGMRPGEAVFFISGSPFTGLGDGATEHFETPRFVINSFGGVHDLGDIIVRSLDTGRQIQQLYNIHSREQLAQVTSLRKPAAESSIAAAREALTRYRSAMISGDLDTVHHLTSHASMGWSEDRREFLTKSALRIPTIEHTQPLRFVPGDGLASLLAQNKVGALSLYSSFGEAAADLQASPDWVVFATSGPESVRIAGIAHREQGEWKVLGAASLFGSGLGSLFLLDGTDGEFAPRAAGFRRSAPLPEATQLDAARAVGEKYLAAWSRGEAATQFALTSPFSAGTASTVADLRKAWTLRLDKGISPISELTTLHLTPIPGLTEWESEWLARYARTGEELSGQQRAEARVSTGASKDFPDRYVERGDLIPFRYHAGKHDFLILMVKHAGIWQVLEPAMAQ